MPGGKARDPKPRVPKPPVLKQTSLSPKLSLTELPMEHELLSAEPVGPALQADNAATRFVLVPASQFGATGIGGWVAKIKSVARNRQQATTVIFKDADGKTESHHFTFEHVAASFKPLS